jgi:hypothetical protein
MYVRMYVCVCVCGFCLGQPVTDNTIHTAYFHVDSYYKFLLLCSFHYESLTITNICTFCAASNTLYKAQHLFPPSCTVPSVGAHSGVISRKLTQVFTFLTQCVVVLCSINTLTLCVSSCAFRWLCAPWKLTVSQRNTGYVRTTLHCGAFA